MSDESESTSETLHEILSNYEVAKPNVVYASMTHFNHHLVQVEANKDRKVGLLIHHDDGARVQLDLNLYEVVDLRSMLEQVEMAARNVAESEDQQ